MRLKKDDYYLGISKAVSERSTCLRAYCGAIIVSKDSIISTGFNGNPRNSINCVDVGKCPREDYKPQKGMNLCNAVHGEMNCFINLCRNGGGYTMGSTMYIWFKRLDNNKNTYNKPCDNCFKHILNSGIEKIINYTEDNYKTTLDITIIKDGKWETERIYAI